MVQLDERRESGGCIDGDDRCLWRQALTLWCRMPMLSLIDMTTLSAGKRGLRSFCKVYLKTAGCVWRRDSEAVHRKIVVHLWL